MKKFFHKAYLVLLLIFFYLPIAYTIIFSFNSSKSLTIFDGFSLRWYERMFESRTMMEAVWYTFLIAILSTILATIIGTIASIGLSKSKKIIRLIMDQVNNIPVMMPEIVIAIGLLMLFSSFKIEKGFLTMLIAHVMFCTPYVMLSVTPKLRSLDPNLMEAALDLGATPWQALIKVIVPQIMPGVVSGALIAFTMSIDDFVISYFVTGNGVSNISILVYSMSKRVNPSINAVSSIVILIITIALVIMNVLPLLKKQQAKILRNVGLVGLCGIVLWGGMTFMKPKEATVYTGQTLKVFNAGEYIDESILTSFEEKFGVKVIYETFSSNEAMYTKIQTGASYDIIVPSDYMIERMIQEGLVQEIDHSKIPNMENLAFEVDGLDYDPDHTYSIPYFWGNVGIVYNKNNVDYEDLETQGFNIFLNEKYAGRIYIYDSERDSFMMAFKALGYSMNTSDENQIQEAYEWLVEMNKKMNPAYVTDEVIDSMMAGRKDLAVVYSGDAVTILDENEDMGYYVPTSGTNVWCDAMVIPSNATNVDLAHEFMNYILEYDISYMNAEYNGYASAHADVLYDMANDVFEGNEAYYPRSEYPLDEMFVYNKELTAKLSELWVKVKAY
ncbi:MAG: extracellular solute-binding protein [Traorella sp.]